MRFARRTGRPWDVVYLGIDPRDIPPSPSCHSVSSAIASTKLPIRHNPIYFSRFIVCQLSFFVFTIEKSGWNICISWYLPSFFLVKSGKQVRCFKLSINKLVLSLLKDSFTKTLSSHSTWSLETGCFSLVMLPHRFHFVVHYTWTCLSNKIQVSHGTMFSRLQSHSIPRFCI